MQSWILTCVLILGTGFANAAEPSGLPSIPAPTEAAEPLAPLDGVWPAAPADASASLPVADESGAPTAVPAIPAPALGPATADARAAAQSAAPVPPTEPLAVEAEVAPMAVEPEVAPVAVEPEVVPVAVEAEVAPAAPVETRADAAPVEASDAVPVEASVTVEQPAPRPRPAFDPAGTIHVVEKGDTLWDISNLYLGTPWIWPSVWKDNEDIANPHLILPGDKIWVSAYEMRKVTDEEAAALLAGKDSGNTPAAMAEDAPAGPVAPAPREVFEYTRIHTVGLVSEEELVGLARVVGTTEEQIFLTQGDVVFVDLGEDQVSPGDEFTIFRTSQKVYDPGSHDHIGYHTEVLGWLEITRVHGETARAKVRRAVSDFVPGKVYLRPHQKPTQQIAIKDSPPGIEGQIADLMLHAKYRGGGDVVVLNRGSEAGLETGNRLEVYRVVADQWKDNWYGRQPRVEIPHEVVAELIVLSTQKKTAMAYVRTASTELWHGDRFRTVGGPSVQHSAGLLTLPVQLANWLAGGPRPDVDVPGVDLPEMKLPQAPAAMADWNLPRLSLPELDGYDPR